MGALIYYLHYTLLTSGLCGASVLLGVFIRYYSDASQAEIGFLLMSLPFVSIFIKPLFCSLADRYQTHQLALILSLVTMLIGYTPFVAIPFFPEFYTNFPRLSWYIMVIACHVGNGALGVGWSLADSLAVNCAQKTNTPYSRMRLMGTISWGVYGYLIGQINETPLLPKYVPSFLLLHASLVIEIGLLIFWNKKDFEMFDPTEVKSIEDKDKNSGDKKGIDGDNIKGDSAIDSLPSSLGGTLKLDAKTTHAVKTLILAEEIEEKLNKYPKVQDETKSCAKDQKAPVFKENDCEKGHLPEVKVKSNKSVQVVLMKFIFSEDGRLIKYFILFTIYGYLLSAMNFVFLSLPEVCNERQCNFSELAGTMLIIQAGVETLCFLVVPWFLQRVSRSFALGAGFLITLIRFTFYVYYYSNPGIPPYWAIVGESCHGIAYGIFCTVMADVALMFANESKLFIDEIRSMGLISEKTSANHEKVEQEENAIKMSLRATMQSLFSCFMDGLGIGTGSMLCGLILNSFSYIILWRILAISSLVTLITHQVIEVSKSRWSDTFKAKAGTKAAEILNLEREQSEMKKKLKQGSKVNT